MIGLFLLIIVMVDVVVLLLLDDLIDYYTIRTRERSVLICLQCKDREDEINVVVDDGVVVETMGNRKKVIGPFILQL